jgi:hypothetical protein
MAVMSEAMVVMMSEVVMVAKVMMVVTHCSD